MKSPKSLEELVVKYETQVTVFQRELAQRTEDHLITLTKYSELLQKYTELVEAVKHLGMTTPEDITVRIKNILSDVGVLKEN